MDDMTAFERQVAGEFVRRAGPVRPVDAAAIFTAITATQSPTWRFGSMFSATRFVVAGAVVALFGGFLLAGVLTQPSEDQVPAVGASASASPEPAPVVTDVYDVGGYTDSLVGSDGAIWIAGDGLVRRIDTQTREVSEVAPRESSSRYLVTADDAVWASGEDGLLRIEPSTGAVTESYPSLGSWRPPLEAEGSLWVSGDDTLYEVDLESRDLVGEYDSPHVGGWIGSGDGELWLWGADDVLARFDLDRREFDGVFPLPSSPWNGSTYEEIHLVSDDAIWLMAEPSGQVLRFDLASRETSDILDLRSDQLYPVVGIDTGDAVWIPSWDVVYRIDRQSRQITDEIEVGGSQANPVPVLADGALWVATRDPGAVHRIDLESRQVTHAVKVSGEPFALAASDGDIWVAGGRGIVTRISTGAADAQQAPEPSPISDPLDLEEAATPELLPGVDLVTEEVEPGVYRVLSDGMRELEPSKLPGDPLYLVTGLDGGVVVGRGGSSGYRLGEPEAFPLPDQRDDKGGERAVYVPQRVGADGAVWARRIGHNGPSGLSSWDGEQWVAHNDRNHMGRFDQGVVDTAFAADGTVWVITSGEDPPWTLRRFTDESWEVVSRPDEHIGWIAASAAGDLVLVRVSDAIMRATANGLEPFRDMREAPDDIKEMPGDAALPPEAVVRRPAGVSSDGTMWWLIRDDNQTPTGLIRLDDAGWENFNLSAVAIEAARCNWASVAPDGSVWIGSAARQGCEEGSHGLHRFDGEAWTQFLPDHSGWSPVFGRDGSAWLLANRLDGTDDGLHVITPKGVTATKVRPEGDD